MNPIDALFQKLKASGEKAFIPFLTAGDPTLDVTCALAEEVVRRGAALIEIGFPYSDPIADGSVIQASYTRALDSGIHIADIFAAAKRISQFPEVLDRQTPLVAMASYSLVYRRGVERFIAEAADAGFSGGIFPDLPMDEAEIVAAVAAKHDFKTIQLVTPTTPPERAARIARLSTGFLYCVSVTGITGERDKLPPELLEQLAWLRTQTDLPLCVGFGISKPEHVHMLRDAVDGVIVGSAIVRLIEEGSARNRADLVPHIGDYVETLIHALNPSTR